MDSEKPDLLSKIKTLRVYHSNTRRGASYLDLMFREILWKSIGCANEIDSYLPSEWVDVAAFEYEDTLLAAARFRLGPEVRAGLFGSLERICMTTTGDQSWGTRPEHYDLVASKTGVLPNVLLRIPSVKHYCQSSLLGPLAIHNLPHLVTHPPEVVTFHNPPSWAGLSMEVYYPIAPTILYMVGNEDIDPTELVLSAFQDIMELLEPLGQVVSYEKDTIGPAKFEDSMTAGTTLEFYNFIHLEGTGTRTERTVKLQKVLDSVAGLWAGKVFIKAKEDCPPCSACGFRYE